MSAMKPVSRSAPRQQWAHGSRHDRQQYSRQFDEGSNLKFRAIRLRNLLALDHERVFDNVHLNIRPGSHSGN